MNKFIYQLIITGCVLFCVSKTTAQVSISPLSQRNVLQSEIKAYELRSKKSSRSKVISLPYIDDFSAPGPYPDPNYWEENQVFVNTTYSEDQISVGMASFDGLDASGSPYGGGFGPSDTLTSLPIDINSANTSRLFLSFYLQAGGLAFRPENDDIMVVDFSTNGVDWIRMQDISKLDFNGDKKFKFFEINVDNSFISNSFQFRFINYSDNLGINDVWNLDYVRLKEFFQTDHTLETDLAFRKQPNSILKKYTKIPVRQLNGFVAAEVRDDIDISVNNQFNETLQADSSSLRIEENQFNTVLLPFETLLEIPPFSQTNQRDLAPGQHAFTNDIKSSNLNSKIQTAILDEAIEGYSVKTTYFLNQASESNEKLIQNNTVSVETEIKQVFAYDDGTSEVSLHIEYSSGDNPSMAIKFTNNKPDTIQGIQFHLTRTDDNNDQRTFALKIWGANLDDGPLYSSNTLNPIFANEVLEVDSLQSMTNYRLRTSDGQDTFIVLPAGDFYVGWTQVSRSGSGVSIGYDLNSKLGKDKAKYFDGALWHDLSNFGAAFSGSTMIRAVMSGEQIAMTATENLEKIAGGFKLFPNPASDLISIDLAEKFTSNPTQNIGISILDQNGRLIRKLKWQPTLNIAQLHPGIFYVLLRDKSNNRFSIEKFIKID